MLIANVLKVHLHHRLSHWVGENSSPRARVRLHLSAALAMLWLSSGRTLVLAGPCQRCARGRQEGNRVEPWAERGAERGHTPKPLSLGWAALIWIAPGSVVLHLLFG